MILLLIEKEADCLTSQIKEQRISVNHPTTLIRRAPTAERFSPMADICLIAFTNSHVRSVFYTGRILLFLLFVAT
jgi:hypothetical protein